MTVEPFLFHLPCTNDFIVAEEAAFRHRYLNFSAEKFSQRIAEGIARTLKLAETAVFSAKVADEQLVRDPSREIERSGRKCHVGARVIAAVLAAFEAEPRPTKFGVASSFTKAARWLGPIGRIEVERLARRPLEVHA